MHKQEFLAQLVKKPTGLPQEEITERLSFYSEMIDDRMEEGLSEAEAVATADSVDTLTLQALSDSPPTERSEKCITREKCLDPREILLFILGFSIWLSLLVTAVAVIFSLYISLWAVIISLWAVFGALVSCAFGGLGTGIFLVFRGNTLSGAAMLSAGILCCGLSIFLFYGCKGVSIGTVILTKKAALRIKNRFVKKEDA